MQTRLFRLVLGALLGTQTSVALAASDNQMTPKQQHRITELVQESGHLAAQGTPVKAYLDLLEALRLTQLWTNNSAVEDSLAAQSLAHYTALLVKGEDGQLQRLLHSREVPIGDKLNLLQAMQDEVTRQQNAQEE